MPPPGPAGRGHCLINVPTWLGKSFLEFSAFRLGTSPAAEMDDHKMYYDKRDLWPAAGPGGLPAAADIRLKYHKFGLNLFATVRTLRPRGRVVIIARSPLRISLGGGGTDLPSYYEEHGGFVLAAAIDQYVYITLNRRFVPQILLKYAQMEEVDRVDEIKHPLDPRGAAAARPDGRALEITSMADIPAGTGLGSSGSFTTALLKALHALNKNPIHPEPAGRAGVPDRARPPRGADRQAGPVHCGVRRTSPASGSCPTARSSRGR